MPDHSATHHPADKPSLSETHVRAAAHSGAHHSASFVDLTGGAVPMTPISDVTRSERHTSATSAPLSPPDPSTRKKTNKLVEGLGTVVHGTQDLIGNAKDKIVDAKGKIVESTHKVVHGVGKGVKGVADLATELSIVPPLTPVPVPWFFLLIIICLVPIAGYTIGT